MAGDPWFQELFAERIGGAKYGKGTEIYKFEKIKRAKRAALAAHPERRLLSLNIDSGGVQSRRVLERILAQERAQAPAPATALASLMMIDRLAPHTIDHRGLGGAQRDPISALHLDGLEEFLRQLARLAMQRGQPLELQLIAQLGDHVASG